MAVLPKWNAILLQFLSHFKAHTPACSAVLQHRPQHFAHASATYKTHSALSFKKPRGTAAN